MRMMCLDMGLDMVIKIIVKICRRRNIGEGQAGQILLLLSSRVSVL